jgi:hypothetical protein
MSHSHEDGLGRKTRVTEAVDDELQAPKADGFTEGESNVGLVVVAGDGDEFW